MLAPLGDDPTAIAKSLETSIRGADAEAWSSGHAKDWAAESYRAAKSSAYNIGSPSGCVSDAAPIALATAYQAQALEVAKRQIEKAGVRLAWVLNSAAVRASRRAA